MRVSGPKQLDFPLIHDTSRKIFENMFPKDLDLGSFNHNDQALLEALTLAKELNIPAVSTRSAACSSYRSYG